MMDHMSVYPFLLNGVEYGILLLVVLIVIGGYMEEKSTSTGQRMGGWAQFIVTWVIAAVAAVLISFGAVNLIKTVYKGTLPKYPIDSFKYYEVSRPQPASIDGKEVKAPELTEEEKQKEKEREAEQRALAKINDFANSLGQLLAGIGLAGVFGLIRRSQE